MILYLIKNKLIRPVIFLFTSLCFAQNYDNHKLESFINRLELDSAMIYINSVDTNKLSTYNKGVLSYNKGIVYKKTDEHAKAYQAFKIANTNFKTINSNREISNTNYEIYDLLNQQNSLKIDPTPYLNDFINYAQSKNEPLLLARAYSKIAGLHWDKKKFNQAKSLYKKSIKQLEIISDTLRINSIKTNIGSVNISSKNGDSALYYYNQTLPYFIKIKNNNMVANIYNNQARAYEILKDTITAIKFYKKALNLNLKEFNKKTNAVILNNLIKCYKTTKDFKNAFYYADELISLNKNINISQQNQALIDAEKKYRASEKQKQNIILQSEIEKKKRQQRNLWLGGIITLLFGSIFSYLIFKNTKRKQLIAEQEREIEIQKKEKLLKDQELNTIDAMIEGQEKERLRLASDLHDNVGATLSAARLQFEHLCKHKGKGTLKNEDELFTKTGKLLEEAYQDIRSMAHLKNSGVLAKKGLLPAIQKLANNASSSNGLQIEVEDYGLSEKIEASLEITIFRVIQELVTNIIKHAKASEATIYITQHEEILSIIIEDNGIGFDVRKEINNDGMGLNSIEKRIEHLEGTLEIDSTLGKGTNILIDIPL